MKTLTNGNDVIRVTDAKAQEVVARGGWAYCPKSLYKGVTRSNTRVQLTGGESAPLQASSSSYATIVAGSYQSTPTSN